MNAPGIDSQQLGLPPIDLKVFPSWRIAEFVQHLEAMRAVLQESNTARYFANAGYNAVPVNGGQIDPDIETLMHKIGLIDEARIANVSGVVIRHFTVPSADMSWQDILDFRATEARSIGSGRFACGLRRSRRKT